MKICLLIFSWLLLTNFDEPKLVKVELAKGITVSLPADFIPMTDDDIALRYYSFRKPVAMYTSPDQTADFGFNISSSKWRNSDLPIAKDFYLSTIPTMYTKVDFLQKGVMVELNKHQFAAFEFISEVVDDDPQSLTKGKITRQYTYIQYTIKDGKALVFNFTCPARTKERWQPVAQAVMQSVRLK
jgi:hypothetical protein